MSSTERKWSIRAYHNGDEAGILELWKAVYPEHPYDRQQWMRWWHWIYRANPTGIGVICVAEHDGRIVGHAAEVPVMMKIGFESMLASLSVDAMTHPDHRRQGMYAALVKATCAESKARGIRATYSFPNKVSYIVGQKLEVFDIATMQKVVRPLNWRNALRTQTKSSFLSTIGTAAGGLLDAMFFRARKPPVLKGLTIAQVSHFDDRIDDLWRRVSLQYQVIVVRNKEYLNWRYIAVPDRAYLIYVADRAEAVVGYLVLSRKQVDQARIGVILDVFAESEEIAQCLISEAIERCKQERVDLLWGARIAGTSLARAFRRNGFLPVPFPKSYGRLQHWRSLSFPVPRRLLLERPRLPGGQGVTSRSNPPSIAGQLQNPKNWFLQMGDSDEA